MASFKKHYIISSKLFIGKQPKETEKVFQHILPDFLKFHSHDIKCSTKCYSKVLRNHSLMTIL